MKDEVKHDNQREAVQLAYMSGILDGEGCFSITKTTPKDCINPRYTGRIMIGMVNEEVIDLFYNYFGGSKLIECVQGRQILYRWKLVGDGGKLISAIKKVLPYLIVKKRQAEVLLDYVTTKSTTGFQRNKGIPKFELQRREEFYQMMKKLNAVGAPATTKRIDT